MNIQDAVGNAMSQAIVSSMDPMAAVTKQFMTAQLVVIDAQALNAKQDTMDRLERKIQSLIERSADGRTIEVYQSMLEAYSGVRVQTAVK
jgi:hypothetical protein